METQYPKPHRKIPYKSYISNVIEKGGPNPDQYKTLLFAFCQLELELNIGHAGQKDIEEIVNLFEDDFFAETLIGHVYTKPYGYNGDFELLDKINKKHITENIKYQKWDLFFQNLPTCQSLSRRKSLFPFLLDNTKKKRRKGLIISGGPTRELLGLSNPGIIEEIDCIDNDVHSIAHASNLTQFSPINISFIKKNPFRFIPEKKYDFIWIPFLFDFTEDKVFIELLKRYLGFLNPGGLLAFAGLQKNESEKPFLEIFCEWYTTIRDKEHQEKLFQWSNIDLNDISFERTKNTLFTKIQLAGPSCI